MAAARAGDGRSLAERDAAQAALWLTPGVTPFLDAVEAAALALYGAQTITAGSLALVRALKRLTPGERARLDQRIARALAALEALADDDVLGRTLDGTARDA